MKKTYMYEKLLSVLLPLGVGSAGAGAPPQVLTLGGRGSTPSNVLCLLGVDAQAERE